MPWCENQHCRKSGLKKDDVEFDDDLHMVLCTGCYALRHPGWVPPVEGKPVLPVPPGDALLRYEVHFTSERGLAARVGYGDLSFSFMAPMSEIQRYLGFEER